MAAQKLQAQDFFESFCPAAADIVHKSRIFRVFPVIFVKGPVLFVEIGEPLEFAQAHLVRITEGFRREFYHGILQGKLGDEVGELLSVHLQYFDRLDHFL